MSAMMHDFKSAEIQTGETSIFLRSSGSGRPILLLHGFPQTHLMWRGVAPLLAREFTVVCADSSRLRTERLSSLRSRSCALCETGDGAGHDCRDGAAWICALLCG